MRKKNPQISEAWSMSDVENEQAVPETTLEESDPKPVVAERTLTVRGLTKTISEWAAERGIAPGVIEWRLDRGLSPERALGGPLR